MMRAQELFAETAAQDLDDRNVREFAGRLRKTEQ